MGRAPCCEKVGLNKGAWTREEDMKLIEYITVHGEGNWRNLPKAAGLLRCGKSCRLRWINYLRPDLKRGNITEEEDMLIVKLHSVLGNRWSMIAGRLPGRTDNEIKNHWNTHLKKKLKSMGIDPNTHKPLQQASPHDKPTPSSSSSSSAATVAAEAQAPAVPAPDEAAAPLAVASKAEPSSSTTKKKTAAAANASISNIAKPRIRMQGNGYGSDVSKKSGNNIRSDAKPSMTGGAVDLLASSRRAHLITSANPSPPRDYKAKPMFFLDSSALQNLRSASVPIPLSLLSSSITTDHHHHHHHQQLPVSVCGIPTLQFLPPNVHSSCSTPPSSSSSASSSSSIYSVSQHNAPMDHHHHHHHQQSPRFFQHAVDAVFQNFQKVNNASASTGTAGTPSHSNSTEDMNGPHLPPCLSISCNNVVGEHKQAEVPLMMNAAISGHSDNHRKLGMELMEDAGNTAATAPSATSAPPPPPMLSLLENDYLQWDLDMAVDHSSIAEEQLHTPTQESMLLHSLWGHSPWLPEHQI